MKKERHLGKWLTLALLLTLILATIISWAGQGRELLKEFQETDEFYHTFESEIVTRLPALVTEPLTKEELLESYTVTNADIEEYRFRYGNLSTQIENINSQYETERGEELSEELAKERDEKIADIRRNFKEDSYVEAKLRAEWETKVDNYLQGLARERKIYSANYPGIGYSLTNTGSNKTFDMEGFSSNVLQLTYGGGAEGLYADRIDYYTQDSDPISAELGSIPVNYSGTVFLPESYVSSQLEDFKQRKIIFWVLTIFGIIAAFASVVLWKKWKHELLASTFMDEFAKLPHELRAAMVGFLGFFSYVMLWQVSRGLNTYYGFDDFTFFLFLVLIAINAIILQSFISLVLTMDDFTYKNSILNRLVQNMKGLFLNRSLAVQMIFVLIVVFFWGLGTALSGVIGGLVFIWIPATLFIGIPALYFVFSRIAYLNRTMARTELVAEGFVSEPFQEKGRSRLAAHARKLNEIRQQLIYSHSSQVKSERLKSELITNVSHDLRTPLTSIITYTDLLKNPNLTVEERAQYVDVLERKSARLKTLIEDLFDVSKMASGNIELQKAQVDLASLLQQSIAEQQEALDKQNLDLRVSIASQPIMAQVDGQKMWRVMDNLLLNISKYSMPGTRVYLALQESFGEAILTFKNVSQYELGDDTAELTERFKRGDQSRHTEGSGLGLAIAQSIVSLHGGQFELDLDGDLFKVTIRIPKGTV
ncbi:histidine kinase [Chryseomicrobium excrementi]|uniref:histidine kinase n=1 Tax=Chryseomicrobium excrementi TaxID=2041346 RepID=A0A2M9EZ41_9BACL|nr:MFS domain-containing histidine kinase [Chryseomicrobium excrementi]PJK16483.1 histidine kinase [Chryseomicrobium excrementi]